jgi:hypothetical protein
MNLNASLFWDVDFKNVDYEKNSQFIINRVLLRGKLSDWQEIKSFYGLERIKNETLAMRYLDNKTLSFCSMIFNVPKTEFRCFNTPQSIKELWNY